MRILIVEDDFMSRKLMMAYLRPLGECDVASNGSEALEAFMIACNENKNYDLITIDIMMPELNGHAVLKHIRRIEEERKIPASKIVMTSGLKDSQNVFSAFNGQCDGYLVKPIESEKLKKLVQSFGLV